MKRDFVWVQIKHEGLGALHIVGNIFLCLNNSEFSLLIAWHLKTSFPSEEFYFKEEAANDPKNSFRKDLQNYLLKQHPSLKQNKKQSRSGRHHQS